MRTIQYSNIIRSHALGHNRTNEAVYSKIYFKFEIIRCCAFDIRQLSHASFRIASTVCFKNPKLNPNKYYNHVFVTLLTITTLCKVAV